MDQLRFLAISKINLKSLDLFYSDKKPNNCAIVNDCPYIINNIVGKMVYGFKLVFKESLGYNVPVNSKILVIGYYAKSKNIIKGKPINKCILIEIHENYFLVLPYVI